MTYKSSYAKITLWYTYVPMSLKGLSKKERERERENEGVRTKAAKRRRSTTNCLKSFAVAKRQFDKATAPGQLGGSVWRWNNRSMLFKKIIIIRASIIIVGTVVELLQRWDCSRHGLNSLHSIVS